MNTTEPPTPREIRESLTEKLAGLPTGVDHDGHHDQDRAADAARFDRITHVSEPPTPEPPAQVGMKPNLMQGRGSATAPAPSQTDPLAAIRAEINRTSSI